MNEKKVWIRVAHCYEIPMREGRAVKVGNQELAVFNLGSRFFAVANRCPHKGGPLADGMVSGASVVCPLHAWKFSLETGEGVNSASASACVQSFPTRMEHGIVFVELSHGCGDGQDRSPEMTVICVQPEASAGGRDLPLRG